jgi:hypothetical protein
MTDVVPFLVYFVAFNFHMPAETSQWARTCLSASIAIFAIVGVLIQAQGALRYGPWNGTTFRTISIIATAFGIGRTRNFFELGRNHDHFAAWAAGECGKIAYVYRKVQDR